MSTPNSFYGNIGQQSEAMIASANDSFGRLRVSSPRTVFEDKHIHSINDDVWDYTTSGGGTTTYLPNESAVQLAVGTVIGDISQKRSHAYVPYSPGKSQLLEQSFVNAASQVGLLQEDGLFDEDNGFIFRQSGTVLSFVIRSSTSGSAVETVTPQSTWNIDKFDGTGATGVTLDHSKGHILIIDYQWLSVGRVRFGFNVDGVVRYAHESQHDNIVSEPYMSTPSLPVTSRIEVLATLGAGASKKSICVSVQSEGGTTTSARNSIATTGFTLRPVVSSVRTPILAVRMGLLIGTKANRRLAAISSFSGYTDSKTTYYELVNAHSISSVTGTFSPVVSGSGLEVSKDITAITTASEILIGDTWSDKKTDSQEGLNNLLNVNNVLSLTAGGALGSHIIVYATPTANTNVGCSIHYNEFE